MVIDINTIFMHKKGECMDETVIISVSGNHNNLGTVTACNNQIYDLLEYY